MIKANDRTKIPLRLTGEGVRSPPYLSFFVS